MIEKNRFKWKCRRGVLELDTILIHFHQSSFDLLNDSELQELEALLAEEDPLLLDLLLYKKHSPQHNNIINKILTSWELVN